VDQYRLVMRTLLWKAITATISLGKASYTF
jgi:hypothetical protein